MPERLIGDIRSLLSGNGIVYENEKALAQQLGLSTDATFPFNVWTEWGTFTMPNPDDPDDREPWFTVLISVLAMPAKFYRFDIITANGRTLQLSTGSGTLNQYWPLVEQFATGMVVVYPFMERT